MKTAIRERWPEVRALFEAALGISAALRATYVAAQASDAELRDAVLDMLAGEDDATLITEPKEAAAPAAPLAEGNRLGRYRILRTLGRGGMGVVYLAEQSNPKRLVALKLIAGKHDAHTLARFKREADALARLSHPGIAQVLEVDTDEEGRPILVMDYVDGRALSEHAASLTREARLELLARIAEAMHHAHERGVVHRDLKPSNVLITVDGQPKILDFGIATLTEVDAQTLTETGMLLGTPAYMAPEQASVRRGKVDARADLYALGVIGYELLTDRLPLPVAGLTPLQALRVVEEDTPPPLSRIDRRLRGDLEVIFGKVLAKEPDQRYASTGAFADDLRRFLANEPIRARKPGVWRRLVLFGRRKPLQLALTAATALSLVGGIIVSLWFAYGQAAERARAEAQAHAAEQARANAEATLTAINRVFTAGNPTLAGHPEVSFREALASAGKQIGGLPVEIRAPVLYALGDAQSSIGDVKNALASYTESETLAAAAGDDRTRLRAGFRRVDVLLNHGQRALFKRESARLLADSAVPRDPLIHLGLLLQVVQDELEMNHSRSSRKRIAEALALWPVPEDPRDALLRAEVESNLLIREAEALANFDDGARAARALLARMQEAVQRLTPVLGAEHPSLVRLRVGAMMFADRLDNGDTWAPRLVADIRARVAELGLAHPSILARLEMGMIGIGSSTVAQAQLEFLELVAQTAKALPLDNLWRVRAATQISRMAWGRGNRKFSSADLLAMSEVHCPRNTSPNGDCLVLAFAAAELLSDEGHAPEAIALLEAQRKAYDGTDPGFVQAQERALSDLYRDAGRNDDAALATDRAIEAIRRNPEYDELDRAGWVFQAAWGYRPNHCARALEHLDPIEAVLHDRLRVDADILARLFATCEVRAGRDPARAIARLDAVWQSLDPSRTQTDLMRADLLTAYLEVYDTLGRDEEFRHWARILQDMVQRGLPIGAYSTKRFPFVARALALYPPGKAKA